MKDLDYSFQAARAFLLALGLIGGGAGLGNHWGGNRGAFIGILTGGLLFGLLAAFTRSRPRGDSWVQIGRSLGLRSVYSGHIPSIPLPEHDEIQDVLAGTVGTIPLIIGDRQRRHLIRPGHSRRNSWNRWNTSDPRLSDPVPVETIIALWVPGLATVLFSLGKRRSLWGDSVSDPSGPNAAALLSWSQRNRAWRLEGAGDCLVLTRPGRLAREKDLDHWLDQARSLVSGLTVISSGESASD